MRDTQAIEQVSGEGVSLLARDTGSGVAAGTLYALVATLDRLAGDMQNELGGELDLIVTGGDGETLVPLLTDDWQYHPNLVLEGLAVVGEQLS